MDGELAAARDAYLEAVAAAPANAGAWQMLGLIEYGLHDPVAAEEHIGMAVRLAPDNPEFVHNWQFAKAARDLVGLQATVFDPACDHHPAPRPAKPDIHIYQSFGDPSGGSEWHAVDLARRLRPHARVTLWTDNPQAAAVFVGEHGVQLVDEKAGRVPNGGTLVIVGVYFSLGTWYARAGLRRTVLLYNTPEPPSLLSRLQELNVSGAPRVELLYPSDAVKRSTGLPGVFEPSPIDTDLFSPLSSASVRDSREVVRDSFIVGRLSRDEQFKFHAEAPSFYRRLAAEGFRVRVMGGTHLQPVLGHETRIELLAACAEPAHDFLRGLDCFTYRTAPYWAEPWGRVVTEAMAVGLPVVVHANGGYAQIIRQGENGFLFYRDEDAVRIIRELRDAPELRKRIGQAARQTVVSICSEHGFAPFVDFYLQ
jgi:glycosyltransferase involved in cell wall biosynthesis